jgi:hypothetical protein
MILEEIMKMGSQFSYYNPYPLVKFDRIMLSNDTLQASAGFVRSGLFSGNVPLVQCFAAAFLTERW